MPLSEPGIPLIAATASPRRRELLTRFWPPDSLIFTVADYDEDIAAGTGALPAELARSLTAGKMDALSSAGGLPDEYVALTADTLVFCQGEVFGKPADAEAAALMLARLSGGEHQVITGLCLQVCLAGRTSRLEGSELTLVRFTRLSPAQIDWYIATGEPFDKAGAYGIQGHGAVLVEKIDGCYYNVMGLPVHRLMCLLQQAADQFSSSSRLSQLLPWT